MFVLAIRLATKLDFTFF